ncbi:hypothetical protein [Novosphingobium gossypii]|uniref:hypothetical protein n=1 Tax=Novosphingobium gossypii TaxID=1604774 RepID=UPI003D1FBC07
MDPDRTPSLDRRRALLCSRSNADRLAERMCVQTAIAHAVVRTTCALQPYRVVRAQEAGSGEAIEHHFIAL